MADGATGEVRLSTGPRTVLVRPGVGAAGHIIQRSDLTSHHIVVGAATLILVQEGHKRIRWSGGECIAGPGESLALTAGERVDISNTPGRSGTYRALWICWSDELMSANRQDLGGHAGVYGPPVTLHSQLGDTFRAAYYRAFDGLGDVDDVPASVATNRLQEILLWLDARSFRFAPSTSQRVRRLLATDPAHPWSMEAVAHTMATSMPTLRRRLEAEGVVFRDLLQDIRMSHALALLQNTDAPVLHIALAAGYASASRFAARFHARFGYLPSDIRGHGRGRTSGRT